MPIQFLDGYLTIKKDQAFEGYSYFHISYL